MGPLVHFIHIYKIHFKHIYKVFDDIKPGLVWQYRELDRYGDGML